MLNIIEDRFGDTNINSSHGPRRLQQSRLNRQES